MTYHSSRLSRDAVRRRLSGRQQRAFDAASELSEQELRGILDALEDGGRRGGSTAERAANLRQRDELLHTLEDAGALPSRDDINPANPRTGLRDPRRYPENPSNPSLRRPDSDKGTMDEAERTGIRRELLKKLRSGDVLAWDFVRERMSPEDVDELRDIILREGDIDRPAAYDEPTDFGGTPRPGGTMTSLAHDAALSASLAEHFPTALLAASKIRIDTVGAPEGPTRRQRIALASSSSRADRRIEDEIGALAPGALRVRLG